VLGRGIREEFRLDRTPKNAKIIPADPLEASPPIIRIPYGTPEAIQRRLCLLRQQLSKGGISKQNQDLIVVIFRASLPLFFK
jgi:hypothetical protein